MSEYMSIDAVIAIIEEKQKKLCPVGRYGRNYVYGTDRERYDEWQEIIDEIGVSKTADVEEVIRCKDCKHSTLPSELTQRYGKPGTLTCHNKYSPCNRRNVSENDFCSYGEERGNG
jgi:hypothetical protein